MDISCLFNPGLYQIICLKNNKTYIGESSNVLSHLGRHVDNLENQRHDCLELQKDFNKYGKNNFKFESLHLGEFYQNRAVRKKIEKEILKNYKNLYNNQEKKDWPRYSQKVKINNKVYSSLREAAKNLNQSRTHITRKCRDPKNHDFIFLEKAKNEQIYFRKNKERPNL